MDLQHIEQIAGELFGDHGKVAALYSHHVIISEATTGAALAVRDEGGRYRIAPSYASLLHKQVHGENGRFYPSTTAAASRPAAAIARQIERTVLSAAREGVEELTKRHEAHAARERAITDTVEAASGALGKGVYVQSGYHTSGVPREFRGRSDIPNTFPYTYGHDTTLWVRGEVASDGTVHLEIDGLSVSQITALVDALRNLA